MIEVQMEGYDKLSDDMNEALDRAVNAINGKADELKTVAGQVLASLDGHGKNVTDTVDSIIEGNGTKIHNETTELIKELNKENGITKLLTDIGASWSGVDIKTALKTRLPEEAVANIDTNLRLIKDSLGVDRTPDLAKIERYLQIIAGVETDEEKAERLAKSEEIQEAIRREQTNIDNAKKQIAKYEDKKKYTGNAETKKKMDQKIKDANRRISTYESNIINLQNQLTELNAPFEGKGTTGETARGEKNIGGSEAEKAVLQNQISDLTEQIDTLNAQISQKSGGIVDVNEKMKQYDETTNSLKASYDEAVQYVNNFNAEAANLIALANATKNKKQKNAYNVSANNASVSAANWLAEANNRNASYTSHANNRQATLNSYNAANQQIQSDINQIEADRAILEAQIAELEEKLKALGSYASGSKRINKKQLAWTNENFDKVGSEIIIRPSDGAILTPLKAGDSVIPANLADNLFKWGAISPDQFATNPFMGKWDAQGGSIGGGEDNIVNMPQQVQLSFDSLFHIEGNVDAEMMPRLENLGKSLVNNREFQKNVIKFVTKDFVRESKKQGIR